MHVHIHAKSLFLPSKKETKKHERKEGSTERVLGTLSSRHRVSEIIVQSVLITWCCPERVRAIDRPARSFVLSRSHGHTYFELLGGGSKSGCACPFVRACLSVCVWLRFKVK